MRRSHRLALSAAALFVACVLGGAGARLGVVASRAERSDGSDVSTPRGALVRGIDAGAGRVARGARDPQAARAAARAAHEAPPRSRRNAPDAFPTAPIALDAPRALGVALAVGGRDPAAPRALDLWRIEASGHSARVARGHSDTDGSLHFPPLLLPAHAVELVAAPLGAGPRGAGASPAVIARRDPAAPRVVVTPRGDGLLLRVDAAESGGAIVVEAPGAEADDAVTLARVELAPRADAAPVPTEIMLSEPRGVALRVVQIDPEGRRSPPRPVFVHGNEATEE